MNKALKALVYYLRKTDEVFAENQPFQNFYELAKKDTEFAKYLDYDLLVAGFFNLYLDYSPYAKDNITDEDIQELRNRILEYLKINHYPQSSLFYTNRIIVRRKIKLGRFTILPDATSDKVVFDNLKETISDKKSQARILSLFEHGKRTRAFRRQGAAIIHKAHSSVSKYKFQIYRELGIFLQVLKFLASRQKDEVFKPGLFFLENKSYFPKHIFMISKLSSNSHYTPLRYDLTRILDFRDLTSIQLRYADQIIKVLSRPGGHEVDRRFSKAMFFYCKALDQRFHQHVSEGYGLEILFYFIALESMVLFGQGDKRTKVSTLVSNLIGKNKKRKTEVYKCLSSSYMLRSDYVHEGKDFPKLYDEDITTNLSELKVNQLRDIVAELIILYPKLRQSLTRKLRKADSESANVLWRRRLDQIWETQQTK